MHPRATFLITFVACLCAAGGVHAQRSSAGPMSFLQVDVQVRYPDGSPGPAGIHIVLENAIGGFDTDCQTVEGGKCRLQPSATGIYIVKLGQSDYEEVSEKVELTGIPHAYVTLTLRSKDAKAGATEAKDVVGGEISVTDYGIPEKARQEYGKGEAALRQKNFAESVRHFEKAVKLYKNYPQAYRMLGETYLQQQDWTKSEDAFKQSIALNPGLADTYIDLGAVYNQQKDYPQAEEALKKGLALSPNSPAAQYEMAKTYWAMNRWQDAAPLVQDVVRQTPELAAAHVLYGNILLKQRDAAGALREYKEYLRLDPLGAMASEVQAQVEKLQNALGVK